MPPATANPSSSTAAPESRGSPREQEAEDVEEFRQLTDDLVSRTDELEQKVNEVVEYYHCKRHGSISSSITGTKRSQDLMRQFTAILRQITSDKMAEPFLEPVDAEALELDDYHEIIKKPMDFSTIKKRMEANDESRYESILDIYSDVKLVFANAMLYNSPTNFFHQMAKTLLDKFELKCRHLLPKILEEEARQKEDKAQAAANAKITPEAVMARLAWDTDNKLNEVSMQLEELRKKVIQRCRKMSTEEKRKLGSALCLLPPEDLNKALEVVAKDNPNFQSTAEEVDLDMDAQSETTLWKLKFFVKEALERESKKSGAAKMEDHALAKRKRDISNAIASNKMKKSKKQY